MGDGSPRGEKSRHAKREREQPKAEHNAWDDSPRESKKMKKMKEKKEGERKKKDKDGKSDRKDKKEKKEKYVLFPPFPGPKTGNRDFPETTDMGGEHAANGDVCSSRKWPTFENPQMFPKYGSNRSWYKGAKRQGKSRVWGIMGIPILRPENVSFFLSIGFPLVGVPIGSPLPAATVT